MQKESLRVREASGNYFTCGKSSRRWKLERKRPPEYPITAGYSQIFP
jgi:hypothetical protein